MCCMLTRFVGYKKITEVGNNFLSMVTELQRQIILCKNMESKVIFRKERSLVMMERLDYSRCKRN